MSGSQVLDDAELEMYATNDILWDRIVSIESIGEQDVFDATVLKRTFLHRRVVGRPLEQRSG